MKGHSSLHSLPKADLATCLYPLAMACSASGDGRHGFWVTLKEAGGRLPSEGLALSRVSRRRGLRHSSGVPDHALSVPGALLPPSWVLS